MPSQFRLQAKNIFLTYPNVKDDIYDNLFDFLTKHGEPSYILLSREVHQSGVPHYHALCQYPTTRNITSQHDYDHLGYHPNMQACRSVKSTSAYIRKDGDFKEWGHADNTYKKRTMAEVIGDIINSRCTITEAINEQPQLLLQLNRLESGLSRYRQLAGRTDTMGSDQRRSNYTLSIGDSITLTFPTRFKSRVPYIWGRPNTGKTSLITQLPKDKVFYAPSNNDWSGLDETHDFLIFDEFQGKHDYTMILQLTQGSNIRLNTKGGSYDIKRKRHCIFLSNSHPKHFYHDSQAWRVRIYVLELKKYHSLTE